MDDGERDLMTEMSRVLTNVLAVMVLFTSSSSLLIKYTCSFGEEYVRNSYITSIRIPDSRVTCMLCGGRSFRIISSFSRHLNVVFAPPLTLI